MSRIRDDEQNTLELPLGLQDLVYKTEPVESKRKLVFANGEARYTHVPVVPAPTTGAMSRYKTAVDEVEKYTAKMEELANGTPEEKDVSSALKYLATATSWTEAGLRNALFIEPSKRLYVKLGTLLFVFQGCSTDARLFLLSLFPTGVLKVFFHGLASLPSFSFDQVLLRCIQKHASIGDETRRYLVGSLYRKAFVEVGKADLS